VPDEPSTVQVSVLRPDDLLNLEISGVNLRLDAGDPQQPALVVADPRQPALLVVTFPPQTTFEEAFFESDPQAPTQVLGPGDKPRPPAVDTGAPQPPGDVASRLSGPTRLVFRVPVGARIPYDISGLLDWSSYELVVAPVADVPAGTSPDPAPAIRPPTGLETTLQLPFRLHLSPTHSATWQHATGAVIHAGRAELWHTRLAALDTNGTASELDEQHTLGLRAIWSPDYTPGAPVPAPGPTGLPGAIAPMSIADRHQIVILTSAYGGYAENVFTAFVPEPVQASLVMLSPLGGWLRSFGAWDPPAKIRPPRRGHVVDFNDILTGQHVFRGVQIEDQLAVVDDRLAQVDDRPTPAERTPVREVALALGQALALPERAIDPWMFGLARYDIDEDARLDLSQWAHVGAQGRDHYVRLVYEGKLAETGHRASLVKVTERRFETSPTGNPVAYLRQYMYIVVKQPERVYATDGSSPRGRSMPLRRITLTTRVTPHIDYPYRPDGKPPQHDGQDPPSAITDRSFWVMVDNQPFIFHGTAVEASGRVVDFAKPLIFVPNSETQLPTLFDYISQVGNKQKLQAVVPGQKIAYADPDGGDNTTFVTESFTLQSRGKDRDSFFEPDLFSASVRIPAVEALTGGPSNPTIRLLQQYVDNGFADGGNQTEVFAEVVQLVDPSASAVAALKSAGSNAAFSAAQSGGFATPQLDVTALTRAHGPLGGSIADATANAFTPADVFPKGVATLFGVFDLADLLPTGSVDGQAPKMTVERVGADISTRLAWQSAMSSLDAGLVTFTSLSTTLDVLVELRTSPGGAGSTSVSGSLTTFDIEFLASLLIHFTSFQFRSVSGAKTTVDVGLDDTTPVEFVGDLAFVEGLRKIIPPGVFGDGVSIDIIQNPLGVKAGLAISLPPAAVGVFALKNIAFSAGLTIPFLDGKPVVEFGFARRDAQFQLAVLIFGGGGFFHLELDTDGIRMLEAAFEFGATASLDIGVASGEVHIMAGIYFAMEKKEIPDHGQQMCASLSGYLRCGGSLSVLGIVRISVEFYLSFTYYAAPIDKAKGRATLTVEVEIACFSKSVELTVERSFGGSGSDPTFADQMTTPALWADYAEAFG
jgi:hypothetical protein